MSQKPNHTWTILLFVLTLILITLVTLHIRQWKRADLPPPIKADAAALPIEVIQPPHEEINLIHVTSKNKAEVEARNLRVRPTDIPTDLDVPVEMKQALKRQTSSLLEESRAQPVNPKDRRALALSPEEVMQLEKEGRMVY